MYCNNSRDRDRDDEDDLRDTLRRNRGRVVTIFPTCGGRAGDGFTGVLSDVNNETCTIISPSSDNRFDDRRPRRSCGGRRDDDDRCCCDGGFGHQQVFPLNRIGCVSTRPW